MYLWASLEIAIRTKGFPNKKLQTYNPIDNNKMLAIEIPIIFFLPI